MKKLVVLGLVMSVVIGFLLGSTTAIQTASWSDPEPSGIVAIEM